MLPARHLLIISPSGSFRGGADGSLLHLVRRHERFSGRVTVIFLEPGELVAEAQSHGVSCHVIEAGRLRQAGRFASAVRRLADLIAKLAPSTVLSWQAKAHIYASLATRLSGRRPRVLYFQKNTPDRRILSKLVRALPASGALACSQFVASQEQRWTRFPVLPVPSTCEFIDLDENTRAGLESKAADLRSTLPGQTGQRAPVVGIVGRLQRWKGFTEFVQAIAQLHHQGRPVTGLIVGGRDEHEPEFEGRLRQLIADLGLTERIVMTGAQADVAPWILACDVLVHASDREPFGQVILEAMALGVPIVGCKPGGPEEIITHEHDGLLFQYGDQTGLVEAITRFLTNPAFAEACRNSARTSVRRFAPEHFVRRLAEAIAAFEEGPLHQVPSGRQPVSSERAS